MDAASDDGCGADQGAWPAPAPAHPPAANGVNEAAEDPSDGADFFPNANVSFGFGAAEASDEPAPAAADDDETAEGEKGADDTVATLVDNCGADVLSGNGTAATIAGTDDTAAGPSAAEGG